MNYEVMNSDICWLSELHHLSKQELDDYMYVSHKRIASKTAEKGEKSGRGSNGMAFIYNSDIVLTNPIEFYGNRIGVLEMDTKAIIGVYMCCNNGPLSRDELKADLGHHRRRLQCRLQQKQPIHTNFN